MKYEYVDRTIFFHDKKLELNWTDEEKPFIQDKKTKEKTYINMDDISHFWWVKGKRRWVLKLYRDMKKKKEINRGWKTEIVEGCLCSLSSEVIWLKIDVRGTVNLS